MLVLVDQHAADERIRLERYLQGTNVRSCMATVYLEIYVCVLYICTYSLVCITCGENVVQINSMTNYSPFSDICLNMFRSFVNSHMWDRSVMQTMWLLHMKIFTHEFPLSVKSKLSTG